MAASLSRAFQPAVELQPPDRRGRPADVTEGHAERVLCVGGAKERERAVTLGLASRGRDQSQQGKRKCAHHAENDTPQTSATKRRDLMRFVGMPLGFTLSNFPGTILAFGGNHMKKVSLFAFALIGVFTVAFGQGSSDPWAGTWKFDAAKSKLHGPAPKEETVTSQAAGAGGQTVKYSIQGTAADGSAMTESYDGKADGQANPFIANGKEGAKINYHPDSDHQYTSHGTGADGTTTTRAMTLSKDGKTITIQEDAKGPQGEFDAMCVYNKQ